MSPTHRPEAPASEDAGTPELFASIRKKDGTREEVPAYIPPPAEEILMTDAEYMRMLRERLAAESVDKPKAAPVPPTPSDGRIHIQGRSKPVRPEAMKRWRRFLNYFENKLPRKLPPRPTPLRPRTRQPEDTGEFWWKKYE